MSQQRNSPASFETGEALEQYRRVLSTPSSTVKYADAADYGFGVTQKKVASGSHVAVRFYGEGTCRIEAAGAISANALAYAASNGRVAATGTLVIGTAWESASGAGSIIEILPHVGRANQSSSSSSSSSESSSSSSSSSSAGS